MSDMEITPGVEPYSAKPRRRRRTPQIRERAWGLFEWTWKIAVVAALVSAWGLLTAQDKSADDVWRPLVSGVIGMLVAHKTQNRKARDDEGSGYEDD